MYIGDAKYTPLQFSCLERNSKMIDVLLPFKPAYFIGDQLNNEKLPLHLLLTDREQCCDLMKIVVKYVEDR